MKDRWKQEGTHLAERLLADYCRERDLDAKGAFTHHKKNEIVWITEEIRGILIPRYYGEWEESSVREKLEILFLHLSELVCIALRYREDSIGTLPEEQRIEAEKITMEFLQRFPRIREVLETDLQAAYEGDPAAFNKAEILLAYPGFFAITVNRVAHELHLLGVPLIPRIMTEYAHEKTGIDIHPGAVLGAYFFIDHGTGIVIGETTTIGDCVKIYQGVTLGALSTRQGQKLHGKKRHPTIEDRVTIYSGASILGGDTVIGHDTVIGANAFITSSVPAGSKVSMKQ